MASVTESKAKMMGWIKTIRGNEAVIEFEGEEWLRKLPKERLEHVGDRMGRAIELCQIRIIPY